MSRAMSIKKRTFSAGDAESKRRTISSSELPNPKELINNLQRSISKTHDTLRRTRLIHLLYILLLLLYSLFGAVLFQHLDGSEHDRVIKEFNERCTSTRIELLEQYFNKTNINQSIKLTKQKLDEIILDISNCYRNWQNHNQMPTLPTSDFFNSLVYAFSIYTTLGYGNVACVTHACRFATIIYAIVGIPLFFAFVSDMGSLLSQCFIHLWSYKGGCVAKLRTLCVMTMPTSSLYRSSPRSRDTSADLEKIVQNLAESRTKTIDNVDYSQDPEVDRNCVETQIVQNCTPHQNSPVGENTCEVEIVSEQHQQPAVHQTSSVNNSHQFPIGSGPRMKRPKVLFLERQHSINLEPELPTQRTWSSPRGMGGAVQSMVPAIGNDQRRIFAAACLCFVVYLFGVSGLLCVMEGWDLFTSFYFLFNSVALVGLGDVFPGHSRVVLINCAFIVLGIVLCGMCYFILQEEIRAKAYWASKQARRRISKAADVVQQSRLFNSVRPHADKHSPSIDVSPMTRVHSRRRRSVPTLPSQRRTRSTTKSPT